MNSEATAQSAGKKAFKKLIWFLLACYAVAYLDRINIGFAALSMNKDLGLTGATFGLANTIFNVGYILFEIPSNLLLVRFGARRWIARIMITWGAASMLTIMASGPGSLWVLRLIVGVAEAGFVPGVLLYLTFWFPASQRGRATALFMIAQPLAIGFGSLLSGAIMQNTDATFGLHGWQWLFIIEGLPAIALGGLVLWVLPDRPADARWLTAHEREALEQTLALEEPKGGRAQGVWHDLRKSPFVKLCVAYFCLVTSLNALGAWTPLILRETVAPATTVFQIGVLGAIPGLVAAIAMPLWGARSDRHGERGIHYAIPVAAALFGWVMVASLEIPLLRVWALVMCTAGGFSGMAILWTLPPVVLSRRSRPLGTAVLSCAGIFGSITSPLVIGVLRDWTSAFTSGAWYAAGLLAVSIAMVISVSATVVRNEAEPAAAL